MDDYIEIDVPHLQDELDAFKRIYKELKKENKNLTKCNLNLQTWLDNKEKVNKQLRKDIKWYEKEEDRLREENKKLKESLDIATKCSSKEEDGIIRLSEENNKLKLHIEAKDKAYTALLKDYEESKEQYKTLKNRIKDLLIDLKGII